MSTMRLAASVTITLLLIALCAVLARPAFALSTFGADGGIGPGALPQFVVVCTIVLAIAALGMDIVKRCRIGASEEISEEGAQPRQVLGIGLPVLALLAAYVFAWHYIDFLVASVIFVAILSFLLAGPVGRTPRGGMLIAVTSILFCTGVWALFVYALRVPLR